MFNIIHISAIVVVLHTEKRTMFMVCSIISAYFLLTSYYASMKKYYRSETARVIRMLESESLQRGAQQGDGRSVNYWTFVGTLWTN